MKALGYFGKNDVRVMEKPRPRIEHPEDAIVRVTTAAICGSDLHLFHGLIPDTRIGYTFGHECVGIVEEVGDQVDSLKPGDRVVVPFNIACGRCFACTHGLWSVCENSNPYNHDLGGIYGYSHTTGGYDGSQAEYVRVPYADVGPRLVPNDISDEQAILLSDIFPTGYFGAEMANIHPGDTVVIFGCGPVGLLAQMSAREFFHAGRVIAVDHVPYRLRLAERCGSEPVNFREVTDIVGHLRRISGGRGPDSCIDAVGLEADGSPVQDALGSLLLQAGSITALSWAMNTVRPGGTVSIVGVYGPPFNHFFPIGWAMNRGLTLRMGQCNVLNYLDKLMSAIRQATVDPTFVVSHQLPLEQAAHGYDIFERKEDGAVKILLKPAA